MNFFLWIRRMGVLYNIGLFTSLLFLGLSDNSSFAFLGFPALVILLIIFFLSDEVKQFYALVALIPFYNNIRIGTVSVGFLLIAIASFAIIKQGFKRNVRREDILAFIVLLGLQLANDISVVKVGVFVNDILKIVYFGLFLMFFPIYNIERNYLVTVFLISLILVQGVIIYHSGGSLEAIAMDEDMVRLGQFTNDNQNNLLGGAMGFPIYSILIISTLMYIVLQEGKCRLFCSILILVEIVVTFFTISKVYILGLSSVILMTLLYFICNVKVFIKFTPALILMLISLFFVEMKFGYLEETIFEKYTERASQDISTGRFDIYESCVEYLSSNLKSLLIGDGIKGYVEIGELNKLEFSQSAHNLYLDGIMSFGIIGFSLLFYLYSSFIRKIRIINPSTNFNILLLVPLISYLVMVNTGASFVDFKVYMLLLYLSIYSFYNPER